MTSLPASMGFSITQMIELGLLDDCLHAIGAHAAMRQRAIAKALRCDQCGRYAVRLHDVPTNPPEGGIDHEACCACKHPSAPCPALSTSGEETK